MYRSVLSVPTVAFIMECTIEPVFMTLMLAASGCMKIKPKLCICCIITFLDYLARISDCYLE